MLAFAMIIATVFHGDIGVRVIKFDSMRACQDNMARISKEFTFQTTIFCVGIPHGKDV